MQYDQSRFAYQNAAAAGATQAGLLQIVYTYLTQDLLRAATAVRQQRIEARCEASKHALLLIGHLESWVQEIEEPGLAESLRAFYRLLRAAVLVQQRDLNALRLEECAQLVLEMRAAWQQKEEAMLSSTCRTVPELSTELGNLSFHA